MRIPHPKVPKVRNTHSKYLAFYFFMSDVCINDYKINKN